LAVSILAIGISVASAATSTVTCGRIINSVVKKENRFTLIDDESYVLLPGATVTITIAPHTKRCIKIRFFTPATCQSDPPGCFVRLLHNGNQMTPDAFAAGSPTGGYISNGFEWAHRFGPATHVFDLLVRGPGFRLNGWTFDVEVSD
jgi:hypothetical protein